TAQDDSAHTATGYSGTVLLSSSDGQAVLASSTTLTNGVGSLLVTLKTAGSWSVKARDAVVSTIAGTSGNITVSASSAAYYTVTLPDGTATTGASISVTVAAYDPFGNIA